VGVVEMIFIVNQGVLVVLVVAVVVDEYNVVKEWENSCHLLAVEIPMAKPKAITISTSTRIVVVGLQRLVPLLLVDLEDLKQRQFSEDDDSCGSAGGGGDEIRWFVS
jgi:hypothetical protein